MRAKLENMNKRQEFLFVTAFFTILVFGILIGFGTITSGFHLVDDHTFMRYKESMEIYGKSVRDTILGEWEFDFKERFRPLYYPSRVLLACIFKDNYFALSLYRGLETVFTFVVAYYVGRKLKCTKGYSLAFSLVILMGPQSAIWWKLGPQELTGTWLVGLVFLCLLHWRETKKWIWNLLGILLVFVVSLYKESYAVLIPAVMLFYLYTELEGKEVNILSIIDAIKKNIISLLALGLFLLFEAWMMVFGIGIASTSYAGVDTSLGLWYYIKMFLNNFRLHLRIGQYGFWVLAIMLIYKGHLWHAIRKYAWQLFLACIIILPQFIVYARSGLEERYVIPWIYGVAFFFVVVLCKDVELKGKPRKYYNIALGGLIALNFVLTCYEADVFAHRGRSLQAVLSELEEISDEDTKILTAFEPYEEPGMTLSVWGELYGRPHVYIIRNGEFFDRWGSTAGDIVDYDEIDIVLMYDESHRHYKMAPVKPNLDFGEFEVTQYGTLKMAVRR